MFVDSTIKIAVIVVELCIKAVSNAPSKRSRNGFLIFQKRSRIEGALLMIPFIEVFITFIPTKSNPNPIKIYAITLIKGFLEIKSMAMPIKARAAKISVIGKDCMESINPVTVVPIFAPMMMDAA